MALSDKVLSSVPHLVRMSLEADPKSSLVRIQHGNLESVRPISPTHSRTYPCNEINHGARYAKTDFSP